MIAIGAPPAPGPLSATDAPGPTTPQTNAGFSVSSQGAPAPASTDPAPAPRWSPVEPGLILALQEQLDGTAGQPAATADRDARRRGKDLIDGLAALQAALLAGDGEAACLARLTSLLERVPLACDPGLGQLVSTIQLRGEIEALRLSRRLNPG